MCSITPDAEQRKQGSITNLYDSGRRAGYSDDDIKWYEDTFKAHDESYWMDSNQQYIGRPTLYGVNLATDTGAETAGSYSSKVAEGYGTPIESLRKLTSIDGWEQKYRQEIAATGITSTGDRRTLGSMSNQAIANILRSAGYSGDADYLSHLATSGGQAAAEAQAAEREARKATPKNMAAGAGGDLLLAGSMAALSIGAGAAAAGLGSIGSGAVGGAVGGGLGGVQSGEGLLKGALKGAAIGAAGGALNEYVGPKIKEAFGSGNPSTSSTTPTMDRGDYGDFDGAIFEQDIAPRQAYSADQWARATLEGTVRDQDWIGRENVGADAWNGPGGIEAYNEWVNAQLGAPASAMDRIKQGIQFAQAAAGFMPSPEAPGTEGVTSEAPGRSVPQSGDEPFKIKRKNAIGSGNGLNVGAGDTALNVKPLRGGRLGF
jgi:hypothetical protein